MLPLRQPAGSGIRMPEECWKRGRQTSSSGWTDPVHPTDDGIHGWPGSIRYLPDAEGNDLRAQGNPREGCEQGWKDHAGSDLPM